MLGGRGVCLKAMGSRMETINWTLTLFENKPLLGVVGFLIIVVIVQGRALTHANKKLTKVASALLSAQLNQQVDLSADSETTVILDEVRRKMTS